jgi:uncharacterized delta-60 repeat protein
MGALGRRAGAIGLLATLVFTSTAAAKPVRFDSGRFARGSRNAMTIVGSSFGVIRLRLDGTRDPGFGRDGIGRATFPGFPGATSLDALVQRDGKIAVSGYVTEKCERPRGRQCGRHLALARFTASGRLDPTFGGDGTVVFDDAAAMGAHVAELPRGMLAIAGKTRSGLPLLVRVTSDGSPERLHGEKVFHALPGAGHLRSGRAEGIVRLPDGREVASLYGSGPQGYMRGLVALTPRGRIDTTGFGDAGFVTELPAGVGFDQYGYDFAPLPDGKLLLATTTNERPTKPVLIRLLANGLLDESFGSGGVAVGPSIDVRSNVALALQPDGKAVVAAATYDGSALARFDLGGAVDASFGLAGASEPMESWGYRASLVVLSNGTIALADDERQLSGLLVSLYAADGTRIFLADL